MASLRAHNRRRRQPNGRSKRLCVHPVSHIVHGLGLAGGGYGDYKVCLRCKTLLWKNLWPDDME